MLGPIANASRGPLLPASSMETRPVPSSGLATQLAGVSSTAHDSQERAPLSPHGAHAPATGPSSDSEELPKPEACAYGDQPITSRLLQEVVSRGREGIQSAGGVAALGRQLNLSVDTLGEFIREDGSLTARGQAMIRREVLALPTQPITDPILQEVASLGREGIQSVGGVAALGGQLDIG